MKISIAHTIDLTAKECLALIHRGEWNRNDKQRSLSAIFALAYAVAATAQEVNRITKAEILSLADQSAHSRDEPLRLPLHGTLARTVTVPDGLLPILVEQERRMCNHPSERLLVTKKGNGFHPDTVYAEFARRAAGMGIVPSVRISDLRWAGIAHMYSNGAPLVAILQALDYRGTYIAGVVTAGLEGRT